MRPRSGPSTPTPVDGIRILAQLPGSWQTSFSHGDSTLTLRIDTSDDTTAAQIAATVTQVLTDPAISHWHVYACRPLNSGPPRIPGQEIPGDV
ncbi:hypothetical protein [Sphaerisporangium sp. TRM90804]|uniref:hypothetical protein n=1 Tax=Sphaerisporangium sp. TRM90804 TaxID=3031113 RepID=UPI00244CAB13|nr:hypothetical protein [Sphaerisporangium sp. TRM90804]MDH2426153.1 hypothetical protein [Sphaerisporangium sp. TRM90804]